MLYDILIIGNSKAGLAAECYLEAQILAKKLSLKIAIISKEFIYETNSTLFEHITDTVKYVSFMRGILKLEAVSRKTYCAKHVIFATGATSTKFLGDPTGVIHNERTITANTDNLQNIMLLAKPNDEQVFSFIVDYKNIYKSIYICYSTSDEPCEANKTIEDYSNVKIFKNAMPIALDSQLDGLIVTLNTYNTIKVDQLLAFTKRIPDTSYAGRCLPLDADGSIIVSTNGQVKSLPICYAVGECSTNKITSVKDEYWQVSTACASILEQLNV